MAEDTAVRAEPGEAVEEGRASLGIPARVARALVLAAVFTCAACGLVYELALVALGSYLMGNSVTQASIVLSVMVFAMGVGSLLAKPLRRWPVPAFAIVEALLALVGGLSVLALYAAFAWLSLYNPVLIVVAFLVGALIGAELPLLMTLLQRIRRQEAGAAVADLFAADYVGALLGGLAFPFLLLPVFGHIRGALLVGAVNVVAGIAVVLWLFRREVGRGVQAALWSTMVAVLVVLGGTYVMADEFEVSARQVLYRDPIVLSKQTPYQEIVITRQVALSGRPDLRLFLNGDLQFSSVDEYRYHESLVHPIMSGPHGKVLVLGGGDGLALREVLRYESVRSATLVELDPEMLRLAREYGPLAALNDRAFEDPRARTVEADAFTWLRGLNEQFDTVIVDMPDPDDVATAKLYSVEFYGMVKRVLAPGGRMVVQSGSPYFAPKSFWSIEKSIAAAGLATVPYHVDVPSFGDWGYVLAAPTEKPPALRLASGVPGLRFMDEQLLQASTVFPKDRRARDVETNTLAHPHLVKYQEQEWKGA
ncbi:polyamine aminopropyltransferase [Actinomadura livida]|uniref:Polyamine aminopropyltransferase n=1 Tax=Actinomadura livida TaxID=79909 RepID=A0A7W7IA66_9ACTN|nr:MULTISPECIES: polyamine aminopropyltransferase [Actinomadura]MBB4773372.1 spermidine synthase [Actinomadura catellatispora]GGU33762.1 polyamine aminopropyltransferase 1 [Actinomadura livida]